DTGTRRAPASDKTPAMRITLRRLSSASSDIRRSPLPACSMPEESGGRLCRFRRRSFVASMEAATIRRSIHSDRRPTMRFLSLIRVQENTGKQPSQRLMEDMGKLMTEMKDAGKLLDTAGLAPTANSKRVRLRGGRISVVDGPFAEAKEVIGGYAMLDAASLDEAIALTKRFVELHVADGWEIECEVRQLYEPDFG